jgi:hypothetical protein
LQIVDLDKKTLKMTTTLAYFAAALLLKRQVRLVMPGKPFQPSLIFESKALAYPCGAPFSCSHLG